MPQFFISERNTRAGVTSPGFRLVLVLGILFLVLATSAYSAQVTVGWNKDSSPVTGYNVYYGLSSGNYTFPVRDAGNSLKYTIPDDLTASAYYVTVTAYDGTAESAKAPELVIYSMTASAGAGGSVSPGGTFYAEQGSDQTFTIIPAPGYRVAGVTVDGSSVGAVTRYTLNDIAVAHSISATFAVIQGTCTITASAGANGSIAPSPSTMVDYGSARTFTITPNNGYKVASVTVDGTALANPVTSYTFTDVTANHSISATFAIKTFTITASAGANGSISPSPSATVGYGGAQTFTITPRAGYHVASVTIDGTALSNPVTSNTFRNVTTNHSISATFAANAFTITSSAGTNGSISPSPSAVVNNGANQTFTITPNSGYRVASVTVDGSSVGAVTTYTFTGITANHTIAAAFTQGKQPPVADAGPAQTVPEGSLVTLNGSNSTDPGNGPLSYLWTQTDGPRISLSSVAAAQPTFTAPDPGTAGVALTFRLTVTSQAGLHSSDTCVVNVTLSNDPPVADAGPDRTVPEGIPVTLDGSNSIDSDDGIGSYLWEQIAGPAVTLTPTTPSQAVFIAPDSAQPGTSLTFRLTVTDNGGLKSTATCVVNVTWVNSPPLADAGPDQSVYAGDVVILDGSASSDPGDGIKSYLWKQISGPPVTLTDPTAVQPDFMAPDNGGSGATLTFLLTIADDEGLQATDTCSVYVNQKPGYDLTGNWQTLSYSGYILSGFFKVKNIGSQKAGAFATKFYLSNDGTTPGKFLTMIYSSSLSVAKSRTLTFSCIAKGLSGKYIIAVVDANNTVAESNNENNKISALIP